METYSNNEKIRYLIAKAGDKVTFENGHVEILDTSDIDNEETTFYNIFSLDDLKSIIKVERFVEKTGSYQYGEGPSSCVAICSKFYIPEVIYEREELLTDEEKELLKMISGFNADGVERITISVTAYIFDKWCVNLCSKNGNIMYIYVDKKYFKNLELFKEYRIKDLGI